MGYKVGELVAMLRQTTGSDAMNATVCAGIDVSAKTLDVGILRSGERPKSPKALNFGNTPEGHRALIQACKKHGVTKIVCEATGVYHLAMAYAIHAAELPLMVANPRQVKAFIEARLRNTQSDPIDAYELAEFGQRMDFVAWQPPSAAAYALHRIARAIHGYVKQSTAAKNRQHVAVTAPNTPSVLRKALREEIAFCERINARLTEEALNLIRTDPLLTRCFNLLLSVPGIAETSAVRILGELCVLASELSAKAWVKLAGLDPTRKTSGTSVHTKTRISKRGNAKLRGALYMPAMSARQHDPGLRDFADRLVAAGKIPMQALVAVQRKLLHGIHAMFTKKEPWNSRALVPQTANENLPITA